MWEGICHVSLTWNGTRKTRVYICIMYVYVFTTVVVVVRVGRVSTISKKSSKHNTQHKHTYCIYTVYERTLLYGHTLKKRFPVRQKNETCRCIVCTTYVGTYNSVIDGIACTIASIVVIKRRCPLTFYYYCPT